MRVLEGSDRLRSGLMGILITLLVIGVGQSFTSVPMLFAEPTYYAQFSDTGGLNGGDKVRIAGVDVGLAARRSAPTAAPPSGPTRSSAARPSRSSRVAPRR